MANHQKALSDVEEFLADMLGRAGWTAAEAGVGTGTALWIADGYSWHDLLVSSHYHQIWITVGVAALASALAAFKTSVLGYWKARKARLGSDLKTDLSVGDLVVKVQADMSEFQKQIAEAQADIDSVDK